MIVNFLNSDYFFSSLRDNPDINQIHDKLSDTKIGRLTLDTIKGFGKSLEAATTKEVFKGLFDFHMTYLGCEFEDDSARYIFLNNARKIFANQFPG